MIEIKNISKKYKNVHGRYSNALSDVSLSLPSKGLVFVVGKTGCGKSTLLKTISTLVKPDKGEVLFEDRVISKFNSREKQHFLANDISLVFQEHNLLEDFNVYDNIKLSTNINGVELLEEDIQKHLERFEIKDHGHRMIYELSGGERQRVSIVRALVKNPKAIFLDEPTGSLDVENTKIIFDSLKEISKDKLVVVVSHDLDSAKVYADRIITLDKGKLINDEVINNIDGGLITSKEEINKGLSINNKIYYGKKIFKKKSKRMWVLLSLSALTMLILGIFFILYFYNEKEYVNRFIKKEKITYMPIEKKEFKQKTNEYYPLEYTVDDLKMFTEFKYIKPYITYLESSENTNLFIEGKINKPDVAFRGFSLLDEEVINKYGLKLIEGELPISDDEVVVSSFMYEIFKKTGYKNDNNEKMEITNLNDIIGKTLNVYDQVVEIVGILDVGISFTRYEKHFDNQEDNYIIRNEFNDLEHELVYNLFISDKALKVFENEFEITDDYVNVNVIFDTGTGRSRKELINFIYKNKIKTFGLEGIVGEYVWDYGYAIVNIEKYLPKIFLGIMIFSSLVITLLATESVLIRKKDFKIFMSLGMKKKDIFGIFIVDNIILNFFMWLSSILLIYLVLFGYSQYLIRVEKYIYPQFSFRLNGIVSIYVILNILSLISLMVVLNLAYLKQKKYDNRVIKKSN
ncbi:ABC transporter ATP-binding protein/permease [Haploplasma axanthum]|uniref:ABC transporter ATP-binding protein/permease n=1 Tax=Haploplasma axanthum TaxID=29552 RepID=UPI00040B5AF8|nr:ABC transporter ATP-binding protein/permease [Haploplasma axanthum]